MVGLIVWRKDKFCILILDHRVGHVLIGGSGVARERIAVDSSRIHDPGIDILMNNIIGEIPESILYFEKKNEK
jgi:hypothetical protein